MHIREFTAVLIGYSHWSPSGVRSLLMQSRSLSAMGNEVAIDSAAAISKFVMGTVSVLSPICITVLVVSLFEETQCTLLYMCYN